MKWTIIEKKYALRSSTNKDLKVPEKPKLKCMGFTYNGAKLFNMLPPHMRQTKDTNTFKTMVKTWIWENIPSYQSLQYNIYFLMLSLNKSEKVLRMLKLIN